MTPSQYVLLTGPKNNAGDYLIRHRAVEVLRRNRPDREIVCLERWKPLDEAALAMINGSSALLLTGGPALKKNMYPKVFPLVEDLERIKVPILLFGVGCNDTHGNWRNSRGFAFEAPTRRLLERLRSSPHQSSVRDYFSLNALVSNGVRNALMTGCPALYAGEAFGKAPQYAKTLARITFSPGTTFLDDPVADELQKAAVTRLREAFPAATTTVAFHHSLDEEAFRKAYGKVTTRFRRQREFAAWLKERGVTYVDLSGSHEALLEHYGKCDFHVGFRVHAHILMSSVGRPSILLAEDGRGIALRAVLGGPIFDSFVCEQKRGWFDRGVRKITDARVVDDVIAAMQYELEHDYPRLRAARRAIDEHYGVMQSYLRQLP